LGRKLFIEAHASISVPHGSGFRRPEGRLDRELIAGEELLHPRLSQHRAQELRGDLALEQPVSVGGEAGMIPGRIVPPSPTNQRNSKWYSIRSISCRSERIEGRPIGESSAANSRSSAARAALAIARIEPQRMIPPHPRLKVHLREQRSRPLVHAPHRSLSTDSHREGSVPRAASEQTRSPTAIVVRMKLL
jgi:hypothetical protein